MKKKIFFAVIMMINILITSCEYHHNSRIINDSGNNIELIISFNRTTFQKAWGKESYFPFLRGYNHEPPRVILLDFDSVHLVSHYRVKNKGFFSISHGVGGKIIEPTYEKFLSIKVITDTDSIEIRTPQEFKSKFKPDGTNNFEWVIK